VCTGGALDVLAPIDRVSKQQLYRSPPTNHSATLRSAAVTSSRHLHQPARDDSLRGCATEMCGRRTRPHADSDPHKVYDPRSDSRRKVFQPLRSRTDADWCSPLTVVNNLINDVLFAALPAE